MTRVHLDNAALRRLTDELRQSRTTGKADPALIAVAERIAEKAREQGITVGDRDGGKSEYPLPVHINDKATVSLSHAAGIAVQAKHGTLTKAAAAAGFEVHS